MRAVILAGGLGTRISEETTLKPKPMVEIGGMPILWHIMKIYSHYGIKEFVICLGYKGYVIKEFFANYKNHTSNITIDLKTGHLTVHNSTTEDWKVTLVETGLEAMTGARIKKIQPYIGNEDFCLTYGDGVSDVDIKELVNFHKKSGKIATLTAVKSSSRFGVLKFSKDEKIIESFKEKPEEAKDWINGGFFVLSNKVFDYINDGDDVIFEQEPLNNLSKDKQLTPFKHEGFWHAMDTLRDKVVLEEKWNNNQAPWKVW